MWNCFKACIKWWIKDKVEHKKKSKSDWTIIFIAMKITKGIHFSLKIVKQNFF